MRGGRGKPVVTWIPLSTRGNVTLVRLKKRISAGIEIELPGGTVAVSGAGEPRVQG